MCKKQRALLGEVGFSTLSHVKKTTLYEPPISLFHEALPHGVRIVGGFSSVTGMSSIREELVYNILAVEHLLLPEAFHFKSC